MIFVKNVCTYPNRVSDPLYNSCLKHFPPIRIQRVIKNVYSSSRKVPAIFV